MIQHIGCSGWHYDEWRGKFYPSDLSKDKWLAYYSDHFDTVEVNNSFYQLPKVETLESWRDNTPDNFLFSLKGSRQVTHFKKLNDVKGPVEQFYNHAAVLEDKLECILWQLPPNLHGDVERLANFCDLLSSDFRNVVEFRHENWFKEEIYEVLNQHEVGFCMVSTPNLPEDPVLTTDYAYLRFHGKSEEWYKYNYRDEELKDWVKKLQDTEAKECFVYFNNTYKEYAVENCRSFIGLMSG